MFPARTTALMFDKAQKANDTSNRSSRIIPKDRIRCETESDVGSVSSWVELGNSDSVPEVELALSEMFNEFLPQDLEKFPTCSDRHMREQYAFFKLRAVEFFHLIFGDQSDFAAHFLEKTGHEVIDVPPWKDSNQRIVKYRQKSSFIKVKAIQPKPILEFQRYGFLVPKDAPRRAPPPLSSTSADIGTAVQLDRRGSDSARSERAVPTTIPATITDRDKETRDTPPASPVSSTTKVDVQQLLATDQQEGSSGSGTPPEIPDVQDVLPTPPEGCSRSSSSKVSGSDSDDTTTDKDRVNDKETKEKETEKPTDVDIEPQDPDSNTSSSNTTTDKQQTETTETEVTVVSPTITPEQRDAQQTHSEENGDDTNNDKESTSSSSKEEGAPHGDPTSNTDPTTDNTTNPSSINITPPTSPQLPPTHPTVKPPTSPQVSKSTLKLPTSPGSAPTSPTLQTHSDASTTEQPPTDKDNCRDNGQQQHPPRPRLDESIINNSSFFTMRGRATTAPHSLPANGAAGGNSSSGTSSRWSLNRSNSPPLLQRVMSMLPDTPSSIQSVLSTYMGDSRSSSDEASDDEKNVLNGAFAISHTKDKVLQIKKLLARSSIGSSDVGQAPLQQLKSVPSYCYSTYPTQPSSKQTHFLIHISQLNPSTSFGTDFRTETIIKGIEKAEGPDESVILELFIKFGVNFTRPIWIPGVASSIEHKVLEDHGELMQNWLGRVNDKVNAFRGDPTLRIMREKQIEAQALRDQSAWDVPDAVWESTKYVGSQIGSFIIEDIPNSLKSGFGVTKKNSSSRPRSQSEIQTSNISQYQVPLGDDSGAEDKVSYAQILKHPEGTTSSTNSPFQARTASITSRNKGRRLRTSGAARREARRARAGTCSDLPSYQEEEMTVMSPLTGGRTDSNTSHPTSPIPASRIPSFATASTPCSPATTGYNPGPTPPGTPVLVKGRDGVFYETVDPCNGNLPDSVKKGHRSGWSIFFTLIWAHVVVMAEQVASRMAACTWIQLVVFVSILSSWVLIDKTSAMVATCNSNISNILNDIQSNAVYNTTTITAAHQQYHDDLKLLILDMINNKQRSANEDTSSQQPESTTEQEPAQEENGKQQQQEQVTRVSSEHMSAAIADYRVYAVSEAKFRRQMDNVAMELVAQFTSYQTTMIYVEWAVYIVYQLTKLFFFACVVVFILPNDHFLSLVIIQCFPPILCLQPAS